MHSEVSHSEVSPLARPLVFLLLPLHCHGLCLAFTSSGGLAPDGFVGIIPLSKNSAPNPDVCRSDLYLEETKRRRSGQGCHHPTAQPGPSPHHRMAPHRLITHSYTQGLV